MDRISLTDESIVSLVERNNRLIIVEASRYNSGVMLAKEKCDKVYQRLI